MPGQSTRTIRCRLDDGSALTLAAERPAGARHHGEEAVTAELVRDGATVEIAEARLTTEYGPDGETRRIGVELIVADPDEPPLRGAGTRRDDGGFDFSLEGVGGTAELVV